MILEEALPLGSSMHPCLLSNNSPQGTCTQLLGSRDFGNSSNYRFWELGTPLVSFSLLCFGVSLLKLNRRKRVPFY